MPFCVGRTVDNAGRSTTASVPMTIFTVAMTAPVLPALTMPDTAPSRISRAATRIDESFLRRTAVAAESSIVMTSLACTTSMRDFARVIVGEKFTDAIFLPDEYDRNAVLRSGLNRAFNFDRGRAVTAHRIDCDFYHGHEELIPQRFR